MDHAPRKRFGRASELALFVIARHFQVCPEHLHDSVQRNRPGFHLHGILRKGREGCRGR